MSVNREILRFVDTIHRDKQVDKEVVFTGIEMALVSAAQKKLGDVEGIEVHVDRETGEIIAEIDGEPLSPEDLGRIAALSGKQVLLQKIREAERDVLYEEYKPRIGQLLTGVVQARKPGGVLIVSLGKAEGILPRSEQSPAESFSEGNRVKVILKEVNIQPNRVQLVCSRASPELVRRLFELEIPEVADYVVEVKAISREAGHRTKIAVTTFDSNVDCVGACVGVKGSRIRNIVDELFGEKIDIVRWNDSIEILLVEALRPAEIASLELDFENKTALVYVRPDQQSLAIGRRGQNVRLASKMTGWDLKITPISDEELEQMRREEMEDMAQNLFGEERAPSDPEAVPAERAAVLDRLFASTSQRQDDRASGSSTKLDALFHQPSEASEGPAEDVEDGDVDVDAAIDDDLVSSESAELQESPIQQPLVDANGVEEFPLEELPGVGVTTAERLRAAGLDTCDKILAAGLEALADVEGIGAARAEKIMAFLKGED